jgi:hypothetical protein
LQLEALCDESSWETSSEKSFATLDRDLSPSTKMDSPKKEPALAGAFKKKLLAYAQKMKLQPTKPKSKSKSVEKKK